MERVGVKGPFAPAPYFNGRATGDSPGQGFRFTRVSQSDVCLIVDFYGWARLGQIEIYELLDNQQVPKAKF
jgi:hypothetical protein